MATQMEVRERAGSLATVEPGPEEILLTELFRSALVNLGALV